MLPHPVWPLPVFIFPAYLRVVVLACAGGAHCSGVTWLLARLSPELGCGVSVCSTVEAYCGVMHAMSWDSGCLGSMDIPTTPQLECFVF
jgi:hypothetical protein